MLAAIGVHSVLRTPVDALPDLSDVQVIVRTPYPGPGAARRRGPGHVSAHDGTALGAGRDHRARLLVLRRLVRQRAVRRWHRSVLGALARARVPEPGDGAPARGRAARARARCDGRGLDLPVRARRPHRRPRPRAAAQPAGLVPQVRAAGARRRRRGRDDRRHGQAVPGGRRSAAPARLRHLADDGRAGDPRGQPGSRRLGGRDGRGRVHGARHGLREEHRRPRDASR